ncbi:MAG TPA: hypothetical protein VK489_12480 [Ferruginibacter sp.]|nr:hypothetical protein [Ferruginibacter sp.]
MKLIGIIIIGSIFCLGVLFGFFFQHYPYIQWNPEIKIYEVFQVITTLFIALAIPFFIKKWIDDSRVVKTLLNKESDDISVEAKKINEKFISSYNTGNITSQDKKFINITFSQIENLIQTFESSIRVCFNNRCNSQFQDFKIAYLEYWHNVTSGDLMSDSFTIIDENYLSFHSEEYSKFLQALRKFNIFLQKQ